MRKLFSALALFGLLSGVAAAADKGGAPVPKAPPKVYVAEGVSPVSCYGAAMFGANVAMAHQPGSATIAADDYAFGLGAGCDYRSGRTVVGLFARYERAAGTDTLLDSAGALTGAIRVGHMLNTHVMPYLYLGLVGRGLDASRLQADHVGVSFGVGLELALSEKWAVFGEYGQQRFGELHGLGAAIEPYDHTMRAGVLYRFHGLLLGQ